MLCSTWNILDCLFPMNNNDIQSITTERLRDSILSPNHCGPAVYLPMALSGYPHCFISRRMAVAAGVTNLKRDPITGTYSGKWPDAYFQ